MCTSHIEKILQGDTDAFRFIVKKHKDDAFSLAVSIIKIETIAKDVVQNAFIKAYDNLEAFKGESKFSTWFYRIVINEAYSQLRKQEREIELSEDYSKTAIHSESSNTVLKMEEDNQRYYINETLKKMPSNYSLALRLFYLQEFSINEITLATGWSESNVKVILHRARIKMETLLTELIDGSKKELY